MKCVKIVGKEKLESSSIDKPKSVNGSVIIKVEACGICGSDIHYWNSGTPEGLVLGHEFSGTVEDPGDRKDLSIGDRVTGLPLSPCGRCSACKNGNGHYCKETWTKAVGLSLENPGGYAECLSCRADMIKKIPETMTADEGCMVEPSAVALHATSLADIKVGDKVLVIGAGIIGLMSCEFAKLEGASHVTMLETNLERAKKAVSVGKADDYYDAKKEDVLETLSEVSNGGYDKVIECCGNAPAVSEAIMAVRPGGKIVLVGVTQEPISIPTVCCVMGEIEMIGAIAYTEKEFETCIDLISRKRLNVKKYIDDTVSLDEANEAFKRLTNGKDAAVKIVFHP
ncbi:MAG: alcohol dehydrogenase catalytic domain-containing protein [Bacilli bacterium]|nr:alcohol dehydrogenase catalytic domain-containing protein [Bacilli bacterium]